MDRGGSAPMDRGCSASMDRGGSAPMGRVVLQVWIDFGHSMRHHSLHAFVRETNKGYLTTRVCMGACAGDR